MVVGLRRKLSSLLASLAFRVNPDPPIVPIVDYELKKWLADVMAGLAVGRITGRPITPGDDIKRAS